MTAGPTVDSSVRTRVFQWAVKRREPATITLRRDGDWASLRSHFLWFDEAEGTLALLYPAAPPGAAPFEIAVGEQLGVSFRRGHKKCVFTTTVTARRDADDGAPMLMLATPSDMHEYQRRAYQRAAVPPEREITVRIYSAADGSARSDGRTELLAAGRLCDLSAGGTMIEVEPPLNPRMRVGETVRVEMAVDPSTPPLCVEGVCRHAVARPQGRVGFGVQFRGLEATRQGQAALRMIAILVNVLRKSPHERPSPCGLDPSRPRA